MVHHGENATINDKRSLTTMGQLLPTFEAQNLGKVRELSLRKPVRTRDFGLFHGGMPKEEPVMELFCP